jgi:hypothetical protein
MHIYAFGSICRGEVSVDSDIDLLALVDGRDDRFDPDVYSIYSYGRIASLWLQGNAFAWHLALEARLLFASDGKDFIASQGQPARYKDCVRDCAKFETVFQDARVSLAASLTTAVFDLSSMFLGIRNIATCYSLGVLYVPIFSRSAALSLSGECALPISKASYNILERSRVLCTRGLGPDITTEEMASVSAEFDGIADWMAILVAKARQHERI